MPVRHINSNTTSNSRYTVPLNVVISGKSLMRKKSVVINITTDTIKLKSFIIPVSFVFAKCTILKKDIG